MWAELKKLLHAAEQEPTIHWVKMSRATDFVATADLPQ
jgi:hypothetical protein